MPDEVVDEIAEMNKVLDSGIVEPATPEVEEKKDETKEESKVDDTDKGDTEKKEAVEEPKVVEAEKKEEEIDAEEVKKPEPEPDPRDREIIELRAKLAEKETKKEEPVKKEEPKPEPPPEEDFVGDLDLDDLGRDPKEFNKVMNKVYQKAVADTRKTMEADIVKRLPDLIQSNIGVVESLRRAGEQFYETNSDLKSFNKVVATVFDEMATANPNETLGNIMEKVAPEARKRLGLPTPKATESAPGGSKKDTPPRLPNARGSAGKSQEKQTVDPFQKELEEMNTSLGR